MAGFYDTVDEPSEPEGERGDGILLIDDDLDGEGALDA